MHNQREKTVFFDSIEEARAALERCGLREYRKNRYTPRTYCLRHGEYEAPEYRIRKRRNHDEYYVRGVYSYFAGTFGAKQDGPMTFGEWENIS